MGGLPCGTGMSNDLLCGLLLKTLSLGEKTLGNLHRLPRRGNWSGQRSAPQTRETLAREKNLEGRPTSTTPSANWNVQTGLLDRLPDDLKQETHDRRRFRPAVFHPSAAHQGTVRAARGWDTRSWATSITCSGNRGRSRCVRKGPSRAGEKPQNLGQTMQRGNLQEKNTSTISKN